MKKQIYKSTDKACFCIGQPARVVQQALFIALAFAWCSATAIEKQTVTTLADQNLVLTGAIELHITSESTPFSNSTVSLNHEDAWVFFENIKPSVVISDHLSNVKVNGNDVVNGSNVRVAIYAHGTVVMPHSSAFAPLVAYKEENFVGDHLDFGLHTYHNSLGTFDNAIKSFKLKRGYMATMATGADGSGYSRVFIADDADLEFSVAPDLLYGTVSFIRVFKHQWVTKKGWCGTGSGGYTDGGRVNGTWYYSWSADQYTTNNLEYAVIKQNASWPGWTEINGKQHVSHLLGYNEPDKSDQSNLTYDYVMGQWPEFMKSGLRLGAPATSDPFNSWSEITFVRECDTRGYRVDVMAIHAYWNKTATQWYNDLKYVYDRTGKPIWITEWNNGANWTSHSFSDSPTLITDANATKQLNDLKAILNVLDTTRFVERYSIYNWVQDARAMVLTIDSAWMARNTNYANYNWLKTAPVVGTTTGKLLNGSTGTVNIVLTPAGQYYAANKSKIAFQRANEVIPTYVYTVPVLSYTHYYTSTLNQIKLTWTDSNEELSKGYKLERKINDGDYETIYESTNTATLTYNDNIVSTISGKISYRVGLLTASGSYEVSNEVSYYQGSGADNVQAGELAVNNSDWAMCIFLQRYTSNPLVFLGIASANNSFPLTNRVRTITTRSFYFHLEPWAYLSNPAFSNTDKIAFMALPAGTYNLGGLKAQANSVTTVTGTWQSVTFPEEFTTVPVVFCTQSTTTTSFPTAVAVRNVTTTGFDICLLKEEAITYSIQGDKVNYFAMEPGSGVIAGRRVTVGQTAGKTVGNVYSPAIIEYDASYTQPALFAGLLTSSDAYTSTLRFYSGGANKFNVIKMRETSASSSAVAKDQMGWMVIDLAPDQVITSTKNTDSPMLVIYPNPASDVLYLNLEKPTQVTVYDMFGRKQMEVLAMTSLNVHMLPVGTYFIKINDQSPVKFFKK
ncbi:MAG: glycosyl hydrolase [Breznakibacter sp.]